MDSVKKRFKIDLIGRLITSNWGKRSNSDRTMKKVNLAKLLETVQFEPSNSVQLMQFGQIDLKKVNFLNFFETVKYRTIDKKRTILLSSWKRSS